MLYNYILAKCWNIKFQFFSKFGGYNIILLPIFTIFHIRSLRLIYYSLEICILQQHLSCHASPIPW